MACKILPAKGRWYGQNLAHPKSTHPSYLVSTGHSGDAGVTALERFSCDTLDQPAISRMTQVD